MNRRNRYITFFAIFLTIATFVFVKDGFKKWKQNQIFSNGSEIESMEWEWEDSLNSNGRILIKWKATKEDITMLVIAATTGYVGIGFSLNREMNGSDIVIGWIKDGKAFLQDYHAIGNSQPILDSKQDYHLLFGSENKTHTILCFKRKLNTCDKDDIEITESTMALLWAMSVQDPSDIPSYHGKTKGSSWLNLLNKNSKIPSMDDVEYLEVGTNKTKIIYKLFSYHYWCFYIKIPNFEEKRHYIGYELEFQQGHRHLIHHIIINQCHGENLDEILGNDPEGHLCLSPDKFFIETSCRSIIAAYPIQAKSEFYPSHVGFPFGSTDTKPMYIIVQFHYNYDRYIKDLYDTTRVRLYHTRNLRKYEASTMNIATKQLEIIPAKQVDFPTIGICPSSCLQKYFPPDGIKIFGLSFHAHRSVKKMRLYQFRDGVVINKIADDNLNFEYLTVRNLKEEISVLPGDQLAVECSHDTRDRNQTTPSGVSSYQEMCFIVLMFYPKNELTLCYSGLDPIDVTRVTGNYFFSQNDLTSLYQSPLTYIAYYLFMGLYLTWRPLNSSQAEELRNLYLQGNQLPFCLTDESPLEYNTDERVTFSNGNFTVKQTNACSNSIENIRK